MLFNSFSFAVFFPAVCVLYFTLPRAWKTPFLLVASCVFYMAFIPAYIAILFVTIAIDYAAGMGIEDSRGRSRHAWLVSSILSTCGVLFIFKYYNFFTGSFVAAAHRLGWNVPALDWKVILPIGLSFHTFQSLSYVIEVYFGRQKAERNALNYATYVMFFPQLVAGPIERPQALLHQFREDHPFDYARVVAGLKRMGWGLFKKVVVADRLSLYVNDVYGAPRHFNGLQLSLATVFFAYQIYCDFSGYSDIALGAAQVLGFRLMENFDIPYYARSVGEFWHRWHISLSTWFRDYVYIPLGGSRVPPLRYVRNVMITFVVSGLWHGANWTFVAWGALHGFYLLAGRYSKRLREKAWAACGVAPDSFFRRTVQVAATFVLVTIGWVLFRARSLADAVYVYTHFLRGWNPHAVATEQFLLRQMPLALASVAILELIQGVGPRRLSDIVSTVPLLPRWAIYCSAMVAVIMFGVFRHAQFIYFQF
jgi:D-alanyl-lipoteichoic acid acyltransferase DltB (MBOAT superfamily)